MGRSARPGGRDAYRRHDPGKNAGSRHEEPVITRPAAGTRAVPVPLPLAVRRAHVRPAWDPYVPAHYLRHGGDEQSPRITGTY